MTRVQEDDLHEALSRYEGEGITEVGDTEVTVKFSAEDIHGIDSPDSLLRVTLEYEIFGQKMTVKLPLPVEAEATGLRDAKEDLEKLIERRNHVPEFPMLVVAAKGFDQSQEEVEQYITYHVDQIPERLMEK